MKRYLSFLFVVIVFATVTFSQNRGFKQKTTEIKVTYNLWEFKGIEVDYTKSISEQLKSSKIKADSSFDFSGLPSEGVFGYPLGTQKGKQRVEAADFFFKGPINYKLVQKVMDDEGYEPADFQTLIAVANAHYSGFLEQSQASMIAMGTEIQDTTHFWTDEKGVHQRYHSSLEDVYYPGLSRGLFRAEEKKFNFWDNSMPGSKVSFLAVKKSSLPSKLGVKEIDKVWEKTKFMENILPKEKQSDTFGAGAQTYLFCGKSDNFNVEMRRVQTPDVIGNQTYIIQLTVNGDKISSAPLDFSYQCYSDPKIIQDNIVVRAYVGMYDPGKTHFYIVARPNGTRYYTGTTKN
ncbi:MAG: hypothetical protein WC453_02045 [Patescibacteria group bacterium]